MSVRVRFAPSPTGYLHVGGARTAFFNYLYAKKMGGTFILRVEDTDLERSTREALQMQIDDLMWLDLKWDEGVDPKTHESFGPHKPYKQSQRLEIYKKYADQLLAEGKAYYDFRTDEELEVLKAKAVAEGGRTPRPDKIYSVEEARQKIAAGEKAAVRFRVDDIRDYKLQDIVRGEVIFPSDMVGDFVVLRSNGMPVYNFCCVIDDALMEITHVFRAEEHLSNTLRQHMIYEALGFKVPQFGHLSLVLGEDRQKLSKRHGATSCHEYMERGYLPEALLNFIALLGWNPGNDKEIFTRDELIQAFDITRLNPAGAVFDETKLKWMNAMHLRAMDHQKLWSLVKPVLKKNGIETPDSPEWIDRALTAFKTAMETLNDAVELCRPIDDSGFTIHSEAQEVFGWETSKKVWEAWKAGVEAAPEYMTSEEFDKLQNQIKDQTGVKGKNLFMPIRVSVIGKPHGSELKTLVPLIHKKSLLTRVEKCLKHG
ncbi:MAG: glutamate--tRNA ligase [Bdellovibrionales bacterium]|nr:glutamate--tRNA ligase [Bdellovibrionales bacterium]